LSDSPDKKDLDAERDWPAKAWHEYAKEFGVFVPEQQSAPEVWEPELPPPDEKGRLHPQVLKHYEHLFPTKNFLRERYAQYNEWKMKGKEGEIRSWLISRSCTGT